MKRSARSLLRYFGRAAGGTTAVDEARETVVHHAGDASGSAASRYDKLDVQEVLERLDDLGPSELAGLWVARRRVNTGRLRFTFDRDDNWPHSRSERFGVCPHRFRAGRVGCRASRVLDAIERARSDRSRYWRAAGSA